MIAAAAQHRQAVVIGAGLLGLEAANGLKLRGMEVSIIHLGEWIMERQLDQAAAGLLQQALEGRGLNFLLGRQTEALHAGADGRVAAVRLKDGLEIPAQLVVVAAGIAGYGTGRSGRTAH